MSEPATTTTTTAQILAAMDYLGPADVTTIAEHARVGYSTAARKLREWAARGEVTKIDRGSEPAHWALQPTGHAEPAAQSDKPADLVDEPNIAADDTDLDGLDPAETEHKSEDQPAADPVNLPGLEVTADSDNPEGELSQDTADLIPALDDSSGEASQAPVAGDDEDIDSEPKAQPDDEGTADPAPHLPEPEAASAPAAATTAAPSSLGAADTDDDGESVSGRRRKNFFHDEGLRVLRLHPDRELKVGELAKLIAAAEIAAGAPAGTKVSTGALSNAMHKAAAAGEVLLTCEKPATFRAA